MPIMPPTLLPLKEAHACSRVWRHNALAFPTELFSFIFSCFLPFPHHLLSILPHALSMYRWPLQYLFFSTSTWWWRGIPSYIHHNSRLAFFYLTRCFYFFFVNGYKSLLKGASHLATRKSEHVSSHRINSIPITVSTTSTSSLSMT
jgi:hypothetical protein